MIGVYKEKMGNIITSGLNGEFDVIVHGCNCFCTMGAGLAPQMARAFKCDTFPLEQQNHRGDINKLGCIDYKYYDLKSKDPNQEDKRLYVVNAYTQYFYDAKAKPVDYEAITICLRKMNVLFDGMHIGLPQIGAGLAGGNWKKIKDIIVRELHDCQVTVIVYDKLA